MAIGLAKTLEYNHRIILLSRGHLLDQLESDKQTKTSWKLFRPNRSDVRLAGRCGEHLANILLPRAGVRDVYVAYGTVVHYTSRHGADLDIAKAEAMLHGLFEDPYMVSQGKKSELIFFEEYDEYYYLVVPVKVLPGELWISSLFKDNKPRVEKKWGCPERCLYRRKAG